MRGLPPPILCRYMVLKYIIHLDPSLQFLLNVYICMYICMELHIYNIIIHILISNTWLSGMILTRKMSSWKTNDIHFVTKFWYEIKMVSQLLVVNWYHHHRWIGHMAHFRLLRSSDVMLVLFPYIHVLSFVFMTSSVGVCMKLYKMLVNVLWFMYLYGQNESHCYKLTDSI